MAELAILEVAPAGTQRKAAPTGAWQDAQVDDVFSDGDEIRNTQSNSYQVRLYPRGGIVFDGLTGVTLNNLTGTVKYLNADSEWVTVSAEGNYSVLAAGVSSESGVGIVCSGKGAFKPVPWP